MEDELETNPGSDELEVSNQTTDDQHDDADLDTSDDGLGDEHTGEDGEDGDGLEDVQWEGKTVRVPPEVKAALMRTADYTRKTQDVAAQRKALEEAQQRVQKQAERVQAVDGERVQLAVLETQLKALDKLDWDKLEEEDPEEANRLFRQQARIRARADEVRTEISQKQSELDLESQRSGKEARATAVKECLDVITRDIKGWNNDVAFQVGKHAVEKLGWTPEQVDALTHAPTIKALHAAYIGDKAQRRLSTEKKLEAGDKTSPVARPGGGASPNSRRTTDATGDKLSTEEWMRREQARVTAKRKAGR